MPRTFFFALQFSEAFLILFLSISHQTATCASVDEGPHTVVAMFKFAIACDLREALVVGKGHEHALYNI